MVALEFIYTGLSVSPNAHIVTLIAMFPERLTKKPGLRHI